MTAGRTIGFILLSAILVAAGCTPSSSFRTDIGTVVPVDIQRTVRLNQESIRALRSEGQISVETPEIAQSGSFQLQFRKPDTLLLTLEGPFGIKVGWALLTRGTFQFYSGLENKLVTGAATPANLRRILHMNTSFDDLIGLFAGGSFLAEDERTPDTVRAEDERLLFTYGFDGGSRIYWIDPTTSSITRIQTLDRNRRLVLELSYSEFREFGHTRVPMSLRLLRPRERQMVSFHSSDAALNPDALQFTLTIPPNAERIQW